MKIICGFCKKEFEGKRIICKFCSLKCQRKNYYISHKSTINQQSKEWYIKHPNKSKEYVLKFIKNKHERMKELMRNQYYKSKDKWLSRKLTYKIILNNKTNILDKHCKICLSNDNLEIHHEVYPITIEEIIDAIRQGKIYFLCEGHHKSKHLIRKRNI